MTKGGIIIRLIDVAMIILFGFIAISDIKVRAQIKLPSDKLETEPKNQEEPILIRVQISETNRFAIKENDEILIETVSLEELEDRLALIKNENQEMVVLIEPNEESLIQNTVYVLDICEKHRIPKNINYESLQF
ncbi:MAG: ExbD/TolR family protein [bacterium]